MYNESTKKATMKYRAANIKRIHLDVKNDLFEEIKKAADEAEQSVNGYIKQAIQMRMESEKEEEE